jgi:hypothetical protein
LLQQIQEQTDQKSKANKKKDLSPQPEWRRAVLALAAEI